MTCGIYFPDPGSNQGPLHWEHRFLATGPSRKSHDGHSVRKTPLLSWICDQGNWGTGLNNFLHKKQEMDQEEEGRYRVKGETKPYEPAGSWGILISYEISKDGQIERKIRGDWALRMEVVEILALPLTGCGNLSDPRFPSVKCDGATRFPALLWECNTPSRETAPGKILCKW